MENFFSGGFGNLISAGANILGGLLGQSAADKNREQQNALAQQNRQDQLDALKSGIQWRVADAKAAGINPLAALGASTGSFSNVVGSNDSSSPIGAGVAAAGQDLGRAANALTDQQTKADQLNEKLLEAKIANVNADTVRQQAMASEIMRRHSQPGTVSVPLPLPAPHTKNTLPLYQDFRDTKGGRVTLPSKEASEAMQNMPSSVVATLPVGVGLIDKNRENFGAAIIPSGAAVRSTFRDWMGDIGRDYQ